MYMLQKQEEQQQQQQQKRVKLLIKKRRYYLFPKIAQWLSFTRPLTIVDSWVS